MFGNFDKIPKMAQSNGDLQARLDFSGCAEEGRYIYKEQLQSVLSGFKEICFQHCVVTTDALDALKDLLYRLRMTLITVNFSDSSLTGQVFFRGENKLVENPISEHVSEETEAKNFSGIRDDDPPRTQRWDGKDFCYMRTIKQEHNFYRCYVEKNWLCRLSHVNLARTQISSFGVTVLVASCAATLKKLNLEKCDGIADECIFSIVKLCECLEELNIAQCTNITEHGIMYLVEFPSDRRRLNSIVFGCDGDAASQSSIARREMFVNAFYNSLLDKGFSGRIFFGKALRPITPPEKRFRNEFEKDQKAFWLDCNSDQIMQLVRVRQYNGKKFCDCKFANRLINDSVLDIILTRKGSDICSLNISGTFVTDVGLLSLQKCPNMTELDISKCRNVWDKNSANEKMMKALELMKDLKELDVSDSKLSGRMFDSDNIELKRLEILKANRCPISANAVRLFSERFHGSLQHLELSNCNYLNKDAIDFLCDMNALTYLNVSHCQGLNYEHITDLVNRIAERKLTEFHLNIEGIPSVTAEYKHSLKRSHSWLQLDPRCHPGSQNRKSIESPAPHGLEAQIYCSTLRVAIPASTSNPTCLPTKMPEPTLTPSSSQTQNPSSRQSSQVNSPVASLDHIEPLAVGDSRLYSAIASPQPVAVPGNHSVLCNSPTHFASNSSQFVHSHSTSHFPQSLPIHGFPHKSSFHFHSPSRLQHAHPMRTVSSPGNEITHHSPRPATGAPLYSPMTSQTASFSPQAHSQDHGFFINAQQTNPLSSRNMFSRSNWRPTFGWFVLLIFIL